VGYISREDIILWQDRSLADVLSRQAGMTIIPSGTGGSLTSVFTRGTNSNHTSFFLDGRRLNPGFSNQFGIDVLGTSNLDSIQIQRGASSVNYGSNGIGGAIDLHTRSGLDINSPETTLEVEFGSNNYSRAAFDTVFSEGDIGVTLSGSLTEANNERPDDGYKNQSFTSRVDYSLSDNLTFELLGQYSEGEKEVPGTIQSPSTDQLNRTTTWLVSPGLKYTTDDLSTHFFYGKTENKLVNTQPSRQDEIFMESDEFSLQIDYSLSESALMTLGSIYRLDKASDNNVAFFGPAIPFEQTYSQLGAFGQVIWLPAEQIELRAGVRFDDYSDFGNEWTWSIEAIYYFKDTGLSLFTKYATSYVPPRTSDIAFDSDPVSDPRAESSKSYEIGLRKELLDGRLVAGALYFSNQIEDLITFQYTGIGFSGYDIRNVNEASTDGFEFSLGYQHEADIYFECTYTYLTALDDQSDVRLVRRPRHTLQVSADYQFTESLIGGIRGTGYFDREDFQNTAPFAQVDAVDFFVIDLVFDWKINESWSVFARATNLLDKEYQPAMGYPALGRAGYIGARFEF
jgi:vitamin B12 transporter